MSQVSPLDVARLDALKAYAALEDQLARLFQAVASVNATTARAIFHRVTNTRARYAIIGDVLEANGHHQYRKAWGKIEKWLTPIDTARNALVHWVDDDYVRLELKDDAIIMTKIDILRNAVHSFSEKKITGAYNEEKTRKVEEDAYVLRNIVNRLMLTIREPDKWPWTDIFLQSPGHRTPAQFLQSLLDKEPERPPQS